jgi:hypothetical protein
MYGTYPLLLRVRVDTDTRFSRTIKSRNLYTDEGQMERKGQFSLLGETAFVNKNACDKILVYINRTKHTDSSCKRRILDYGTENISRNEHTDFK